MTVPPWVLMWVVAGVVFSGFKGLSGRGASGGRKLGYYLAWPGMDPEAFLGEASAPRPGMGEWLFAWLKLALGAVLFWGVAPLLAQEPLLTGWVGLFGLIFLIHFGAFHLVSLAWRRAGVRAAPLMDAPIAARSLGEFWGKRWNRGFHDPVHRHLFVPLARRCGPAGATLAVFLFSGLVHDVVISLPAGEGFGLPTAYFMLQGFGLLLERSPVGRRLGLARGFRGWAFAMILTAGPAFWLFHPPFILEVILPFMKATGAL